MTEGNKKKLQHESLEMTSQDGLSLYNFWNQPINQVTSINQCVNTYATWISILFKI